MCTIVVTAIVKRSSQVVGWSSNGSIMMAQKRSMMSVGSIMSRSVMDRSSVLNGGGVSRQDWRMVDGSMVKSTMVHGSTVMGKKWCRMMDTIMVDTMESMITNDSMICSVDAGRGQKSHQGHQTGTCDHHLRFLSSRT